MCGIIAGNVDVYDICEKLKQLRYRGVDSYGIAQFTKLGIIQYKELGKNIDYKKMKDLGWTEGFKLGHTRWADSGEVSLDNTHPILSYDEEILLVHNGSLTNYTETQKALEVFTNVDYDKCIDTKILTDYIAFCTSESMSIKKINEKFEGNYAIVWLDRHFPNRMFFARKDSPLYYYRGQLSSDASLFPEYWEVPNNFIGYVLHTGYYSICYIDGLNGLPIYTHNSSFQIPQIKNDVLNEDIMFKEIKEQATLSYDYPEIIDAYQHVLQCNEIQFIGCGSSYNAALLGKKYFEISNPVKSVKVDYSSEFNFHDVGYPNDNELVAISQSGETADTKEILQTIKENKYHVDTTLLTNRSECSCKKLTNNMYLMNAGNEEAVAATKTFTATCMMLLAMSNPKAYKDINLDKFRKSVCDVINLSNDIQDFVFHNNLIRKHSHFNIMSSGLNYPMAREIGLKLREVAQIHIEASVLSNFKHGNLATCDEDSLSIIIMPNNEDAKYNRIINNAKQIKTRHGKLLGIGPDPHNIYDFFIKTPKTITVLQPIINNIVGQLLAYWCAKYKGISPDYCKNLAKAISVY